MKNLLLCFLAVAMSLISCGSDDDGDVNDTSNNQSNIIGTWKLTSETVNGQPVTLETCELQDFYTFNTDGSGSNRSFFGEDCDMEDIDSFSYTIEGNNLRQDYGEGDLEIEEITTLNNTTLSLSASFQDDGQTFVYIDTYTKQ